MEFESGDPSIVRSIKQRDLLNTWLRLYLPRQRLPHVDHFQPARLADEQPDLIHCSVGDDVTPPRLTIRKDATRMVPAFGNSPVRALDEFVGPRMAPVIMPIWYACISRGLPAYSISQVTDIEGRRVAYERLLLPFSTGRHVTDVLGSLKAISEDGRFEITKLMCGPDSPSQPKLRAIIDRNLATRSGAPRPQTDDVVEI